MTTDPEWDWANDHTKRELREARERARAAVSECAFAMQFLTMPGNEVRKQYDDAETFNKECGAISTLLGPLLKEVQRQTSVLVNMHASRKKET